MTLFTSDGLGIYQATPIEPAPHPHADLWHALWSPRVSRIVDRARQEPAWKLLYIACTKDGHLRRIHQRSNGSLLHQHAAVVVQGEDKPQGQDHADYRKQLARK
jgi:hypothetical protein